MSRSIRLDVHAHLAPVFEERLAAVEGVTFDAGTTSMTVDGHRVGLKLLFRPQGLIAWMDENGVAEAWVSALPPLYRQHLRGAATRRWAGYLNDGLADIASASGGRLRALSHLPTEEPVLAAALAGKLIASGQRRFAMPCGTGDERGLSNKAFEPLWRTLDAAGAFVFLHPGECADGRLKAFYLSAATRSTSASVSSARITVRNSSPAARSASASGAPAWRRCSRCPRAFASVASASPCAAATSIRACSPPC